jgi:hypothetical protein
MNFLGAELGAPRRRSRAPIASARAWETRRERDERVEQNLDPWEIDTWRRHKRNFKGTPEQRLRAFRDWLEEREAETRGERARAGEEKAARLVREKRARERGVEVPCWRPWRYRTKAACAPADKRIRRPRWSLFVGKSPRVEVPCDEPWRFSVKSLCKPRKAKASPWAKLVKTKPVEEPGIFDDLLYG